MVKTNCLFCNKEYLTFPCKTRNGITKFCSVSCRGKYRSRERTHKIFDYSGLKKDESPRWKGGKYKNSLGYIMVLKPNHNGRKNRYVREHLLVWEEFNNMPLPEGWIIHHLNGIKDDNRIENLKAIPPSEHPKVLRVYEARIRELEKELEEERGRIHERI